MRLSREIILFFIIWIVVQPAVSISQSQPVRSVSNVIDLRMNELWKNKQVSPAKKSSDAEFIRRIYLDLSGTIPSAGEARKFINSNDPMKRAKLIDTLLAGTDFSIYLASQWTTLLLGHEESRLVDRKEFESWLENEFRENRGWNDIVNDLVTAEGNLVQNPALNWYARHRLDAANLADDSSRLFLGVQLGCARCHNHPHEKWKLEDFYGIAAFYSGLKRDQFTLSEKMRVRQAKRAREEMKERYKDTEKASLNPRERGKIRNEMQENIGEVRTMIRVVQERKTSISAEVQGGTKVFPAKFLMEPAPSHAPSANRTDLARWITDPENPYFAKAFVNRVWASLMGKGLVEPVDGLGTLNTPIHPALLDELAGEFRDSQYDIKMLYRSIANSQSYQLSSRADKKPAWFESGKLQMLNADQLLNSMLVATQIENAFRLRTGKEYEEKKRMIYRNYVFLFDNDDNEGKQEEFKGTVPQALFVMNSRMTNDALRPVEGNITSQILKKYKSKNDRIEELFLNTLSRKPEEPELKKLSTYVAGKQNSVRAYEDILWALINSNEFLFNH